MNQPVSQIMVLVFITLVVITCFLYTNSLRHGRMNISGFPNPVPEDPM